MEIELQRLVAPEFMESVDCALCERPFVLGVVFGRALTEERVDAGGVCRECVEWMGRGPMARSGSFPSEEDYARAEAVWRTHEYARAEEEEVALSE